MEVGTHILMINLNVNRLNAPTKRHRLAEWIQKEEPYICCLQETHFRPKDTYRLKVRGWENTFHANGKQMLDQQSSYQKKQTLKNITRDKEDIHSHQGINPRGRHNYFKYLCTQQRSTSIHKTNNNRLKRRN